MIPFTELQTSLNRLTPPVNLRVYLEYNEIEIRNQSPSPPLSMAELDFNYFEWQLPVNPRLSPTPPRINNVDYEEEGNEEYVNEEPQPLDLRIINVDDDDDEEEQVVNVDSEDDDVAEQMEVIIIDDDDEKEINVDNNNEKPLDLRVIIID